MQRWGMLVAPLLFHPGCSQPETLCKPCFTRKHAQRCGTLGQRSALAAARAERLTPSPAHPALAGFQPAGRPWGQPCWCAILPQTQALRGGAGALGAVEFSSEGDPELCQRVSGCLLHWSCLQGSVSPEPRSSGFTCPAPSCGLAQTPHASTCWESCSPRSCRSRCWDTFFHAGD